MSLLFFFANLRRKLILLNDFMRKKGLFNQGLKGFLRVGGVSKRGVRCGLRVGGRRIWSGGGVWMEE
jgi:hypothetical protein